MVDFLSSEQRSALMARIGAKNTEPEMLLGKSLHRLGYRYRLHDRRLPGTPDVVFTRKRAVIHVHGCFWHRHKGCSKATMPKTRVEFWKRKFRQNIERDRRNSKEVRKLGWEDMVVWECETTDLEKILPRVIKFLENHPA